MAGVQIIASAWFVLRNTAELDLDNASERTCFPSLHLFPILREMV
jgi:hypothetical protein